MTEINADTQDEETGTTPDESTEEENDNSSSSQDETNETVDTQSPEGEGANTQEDPDKDKPFHQHPRWKEREDEWDKRYNDQETRHQDDIKKLRDEFTPSKKEDEPVVVPDWFGGDEESYKSYLADRKEELQTAEDRAFERLKSSTSAESKAQEEATAFMKSEITAIQSDKDLNPSGQKIDANKLLKIVMDNDLIDSKGKWNYRAGFKLMGNKINSSNNKDRKAMAGATTSETKGETKPATLKSRKDFQVNKPW